MKKSMYALAISASLLALGAPGASATENCIPIGGMVAGQFYDGGKQVIGAMAGTWAATHGTVVSEKKTATGILLGMEHAFSTSRGGVVRTRDKVVLTTVPGKKGVYALDITYTVAEAFGHLKGYTGSFNSFGRINLNTGEAVVRYAGQLCK